MPLLSEGMGTNSSPLRRMRTWHGREVDGEVFNVIGLYIDTGEGRIVVEGVCLL